jgi:hypothetical protein
LNEAVNTMKTAHIAMIFALGSFSAAAFAGGSESTDAATQTPIETYSYATDLDVQKVITISETPDQCGPVPVQMTYEDSHGQRHILQYQVMGTGCSNG